MEGVQRGGGKPELGQTAWLSARLCPMLPECLGASRALPFPEAQVFPPVSGAA